MNSRFILVGFLCALLCPGASAQPVRDMDVELRQVAARLATLIKANGKKKVTVLDFTDLQGGRSELGKYVAEQLTVNLVMVKTNFSVVDRANLKKILAEHKLATTGLIDPDTTKKLGQFVGVDALILGTVVVKSRSVALTAKVITTDTAELAAADNAEFKLDETVQKLASQPVSTDDSEPKAEGSPTPPPTAKPFGELQAKVQSLRLAPGGTSPFDSTYGDVTVTLIITNSSASKTYGVAMRNDFYSSLNLINKRGEQFKAATVAGIETGFANNDGQFQGSMTDIPPKSAITITSKTQGAWSAGRPGDFRPYQLQALFIFAEQEAGRYPNQKKYNLVTDVK